MVKKFSLFIISLIFVFNLQSFANGDELDISAQSAVLMCAENNSVVYAKNENEERPMASTTKIITALIALEEMELRNREVTVTDEMVRVEGTSMGLLPGNIVDLYALAQGMMMASGNDAANSTAIALAGSKEKFAEKMNEKAKQIGMNHTLFVTPSGLDEGNHHSTAYDMALLGSYAMENKKFSDIVSQKCMKIVFKKPEQVFTLVNHNKLLRLYKDCIGIKTGFTKKAGRCLVSCAERDGVRLVAVTLNAPSDWNDHIKMFDYGFSKVKSVKFDDSSFRFSMPLVGAIKSQVELEGATSDSISIKSDDLGRVERYVELQNFVYAPIKTGQTLGKVVYKLDGKVIAQNNLTSKTEELYFAEKKNIVQKILEFFQSMF